MQPQTILKPTRVDLKRLPLGAREAYVLSQLDGQLTLEDLAEVTGLGSGEVMRVAKLLLELGAVTEAERRSARIDPRAEALSIRPGARSDKRSLRPDPRAEKVSLRPAASAPRTEKRSLRPPATVKPAAAAARAASARPAPRRSRKSMHAPRMPSATPAARATPARVAAVGDEVCELDDTTLGAITALDTKLTRGDFYALLDLARDADKKTIKRAYFAYVSKFHPDRFFGKKLGPARALIDRIFHRMTEAHDTLTNAKERADYDARLGPASKAAMPPPPPPKEAPAPLSAPTPAPPPPPARLSRKLSRAMKAASRRPPPKAMTIPPISAPSRRPPPPSVSSRTIDERKRDLLNGTIEVKVQARIDMLVDAAQEALKTNDVATAANNFRLALEHREDPRIRMMFDDVDARAKTHRFDKNMVAARAAERDSRWGDAAIFLSRAYDAKADCDVASRAAKALRLSGGDLNKAAALAEASVATAPRNAAYRLVLAEIYLVSGRVARAEEECEAARELSPKDEHVRALGAEISKKAKER